MSSPATEAYSRQLNALSVRALEAAGQHEYRLAVAGQNISLKFAGKGLTAAVLPALQHLITETTAPADLTVTLWDSASTGLALPPFPWHPLPGEAWKIDEGRTLALFVPARASLVWLDRLEHRAVYWVPDAANVRRIERCDPMLDLWVWWFERQPAQLLHAAAIGGKSGAALLVGRGGSGKSTTALRALHPPLRYLADDYCLVTTPPHPVVHSLFSSAKVLLADQPRYPDLAPAHIGDNVEKALYILYPHLSRLFAPHLPLQAILVPRITGTTQTRLEPANPMDVVRALAPSTLLQLRVGSDPARALRMMAETARQVPCYHLRLGTDPDHVHAVLTTLLGD